MEKEKNKCFYKLMELDDIVAEIANGIYVIPSATCEYDFGAARRYCEKCGIELSDFTQEDWENFRIKPEKERISKG